MLSVQAGDVWARCVWSQEAISNLDFWFLITRHNKAEKCLNSVTADIAAYLQLLPIQKRTVVRSTKEYDARPCGVHVCSGLVVGCELTAKYWKHITAAALGWVIWHRSSCPRQQQEQTHFDSVASRPHTDIVYFLTKIILLMKCPPLIFFPHHCAGISLK